MLPSNDGSNNSGLDVKIGVILAYTTNRSHLAALPFPMELVFPAITQAVDAIRADPHSILPGINFIIENADSNCSNFQAPLAAIDMYRRKSAHLFLGPACEYSVAPVARYSGEWGIPVITSGALFESFRNKMEFKLLTRVQGDLLEAGEVLLSVFHHFNWTRIGMMFCEDVSYLGSANNECLQILRPIYNSFTSVRPDYIKLDKKEIFAWKQNVSAMSKSSRSE